MVPADYFLLADAGLEEFTRRFLGAGGDPAAVDEEWQGYLSGAYGVCLKEQTVALIEGLLDSSQPEDAGWRGQLRTSVDELDALERPFAPDYDRARWGPSSRDRCITGSRERFPDVFVEAAVR